jgi:hypothetical protein
METSLLTIPAGMSAGQVHYGFHQLLHRIPNSANRFQSTCQ